MKTWPDNYTCNGQMSIFDMMTDKPTLECTIEELSAYLMKKTGLSFKVVQFGGRPKLESKGAADYSVYIGTASYDGRLHIFYNFMYGVGGHGGPYDDIDTVVDIINRDKSNVIKWKEERKQKAKEHNEFLKKAKQTTDQLGVKLGEWVNDVAKELTWQQVLKLKAGDIVAVRYDYCEGQKWKVCAFIKQTGDDQVMLNDSPVLNESGNLWIRDTYFNGIGLLQGVTKEELDAKYDIPRTHQKEEGWTDDWHYTELELPDKHDIYYCISKLPEGHYNYTYMAWFHEHWWAYAGYGTQWLICNARIEQWLPFAWVTVPDLYYRTDDHLEFLREHFPEEKDWEYEKKMEEIRSERKRQEHSECD